MIDRFCDVYRRLNVTNLELLGEVYHPDIHFVDPAHEFMGLTKLTDYFAGLYQNINSISFDFTTRIQQRDDIGLEWLMNFSHPRLKAGQAIRVEGMSRLHLGDNGLIDLHRDYFDLGAMLYEQLPVLGVVIRNLKGRLSS